VGFRADASVEANSTQAGFESSAAVRVHFIRTVGTSPKASQHLPGTSRSHRQLRNLEAAQLRLRRPLAGISERQVGVAPFAQ
jgi:AraC-like DNA-binding protein